MIYDKLSNIKNYSHIIPQKAIDFIEKLSIDIPLGRYEISQNIYANVEEYTTKPLNIAKMEAHNKYIDIQILLSGIERLDFTDREHLKYDIPYNEEKDISFFENPLTYNTIILDGTNFVYLPQQEAHRPQVCLNEPVLVKKVVVKIKNI